jgi:hypothetical protein
LGANSKKRSIKRKGIFSSIKHISHVLDQLKLEELIPIIVVNIISIIIGVLISRSKLLNKNKNTKVIEMKYDGSSDKYF